MRLIAVENIGDGFTFIRSERRNILGNLSSPIVEQFTESDRLDQNLKVALSEPIAQEIGAGAMTASLLKQVLILILRRSFASSEGWFGGFPILKDPQIARVVAHMAAEPEASHTIEALAKIARLSRSSFMQQFSETVGSSPLVILRQLRMKKAASLLEANIRSVKQIASAAGYKNRSSFSRAFRATYGADAMEYRRTHSARETPDLRKSQRHEIAIQRRRANFRRDRQCRTKKAARTQPFSKHGSIAAER